MADNEQILKSLDSIESFMKHVQTEADENKVSINSATAKLKELGAAQAKMAIELSELKQEATNVDQCEQVFRSIGQQATATDIVKNYRKQRSGSATFEITKATVTSGATNTSTRNTITPAYQAGMVTFPEQPLEIEALFPHIPVGTDAIEYLKEGSVTSNAQVTAEGTELTESTISKPSIQTATCVNIGSYSVITEQLLTNEAAFAAYIDRKLQYKLQLEIENQLINGTGGSTQLSGVLNTGNFTDATATIQGKLPSTKQLFDFALLAKAELTKKFYQPEYFLLNPDEWAQLCLLKDSKGQYILGGPQMVHTKNLWGTPVITNNFIPAGKYILGNFTLGATIYDRQALSFKISDQDSTNFRSMLYTLRVNRRLGFAVENPNAILGGDFNLGG